MNTVISAHEAPGGWIVKVVSPAGTLEPLYCVGSFKRALLAEAAAGEAECRYCYTPAGATPAETAGSGAVISDCGLLTKTSIRFAFCNSDLNSQVNFALHVRAHKIRSAKRTSDFTQQF